VFNKIKKTKTRQNSSNIKPKHGRNGGKSNTPNTHDMAYT